MANNFIFNDNKESLNGEELSQSTDKYNFPNDASTLEHEFQPYGTYTAKTFTVTFDDNGSGTSATQTVKPFETIGYAISTKKLAKSGYSPTYYFNEGIVTEDCSIKITENISIHVVWKSITN